MRGEWIEMSSKMRRTKGQLSLPMRGEWIEMPSIRHSYSAVRVSPHAGRVD